MCGRNELHMSIVRLIAICIRIESHKINIIRGEINIQRIYLSRSLDDLAFTESHLRFAILPCLSFSLFLGKQSGGIAQE